MVNGPILLVIINSHSITYQPVGRTIILWILLEMCSAKKEKKIFKKSYLNRFISLSMCYAAQMINRIPIENRYMHSLVCFPTKYSENITFLLIHLHYSELFKRKKYHLQVQRKVIKFYFSKFSSTLIIVKKFSMKD